MSMAASCGGSRSYTLPELSFELSFTVDARALKEIMYERDKEADAPYDGGATAPTEYAIRRASGILSITFRDFDSSTSLPKCNVTISYEGGLRLQWFLPDSSVRLVVAESEAGKSYIYHEKGKEYGVEPAEPVNLKDRLLWLVGARLRG